MLPGQEKSESDDSTNQQANHDGTIPGVLITAELESQKEHDDRGADEHETWEIKRLDGILENLHGWPLSLWFGDIVEEKESADNSAQREVDVKA